MKINNFDLKTLRDISKSNTYHIFLEIIACVRTLSADKVQKVTEIDVYYDHNFPYKYKRNMPRPAFKELVWLLINEIERGVRV